MGRNYSFAPGEYYHLYNRGVEKRNIFTNEEDYERFMSLLYCCNSSEVIHVSDQKIGDGIFSLPKTETLVDIGAYCLMPNHFHLLVREKKENGISMFMQKVSTGYTMYFNKKYERTGALFAGRFKAVPASNDPYLKYLFSYIHLNPVKLFEPRWKEEGIKDRKGAELYLKAYSYSSYLDYLGILRSQSLILNKEAFPQYFFDAKKFQDITRNWLEFRQADPFFNNFNVKVQP